MTCITAIVDDDGSIHMGCDLMIGGAHTHATLSIPKIFTINDEFIIGGCGEYRAVQVLQYGFIPPARLENQHDDMEYLCTSFADEVRTTYINKHLVDEMGGYFVNSEFIIGYRGNIYRFCGDTAVILAVDKFLAAGSGEESANAVLYATNELEGLSIKERLTLSLEAAAYQISSVKGPFHFETLMPENIVEEKLISGELTHDINGNIQMVSPDADEETSSTTKKRKPSRKTK